MSTSNAGVFNPLGLTIAQISGGGGGGTGTLDEVLAAGNDAGAFSILNCPLIGTTTAEFTVVGDGIELSTGGEPLTINSVAGALNQVLTSKGTGLPPVWQVVTPVLDTAGVINGNPDLLIDCGDGDAQLQLLANPVFIGSSFVDNKFFEFETTDDASTLGIHAAGGDSGGDAKIITLPGTGGPDTGSLTFQANNMVMDGDLSVSGTSTLPVIYNSTGIECISDLTLTGGDATLAVGTSNVVYINAGSTVSSPSIHFPGTFNYIEGSSVSGTTSMSIITNKLYVAVTNQVELLDNTNTTFSTAQLQQYWCAYYKPAGSDTGDSHMILPDTAPNGIRFTVTNDSARNVELVTVTGTATVFRWYNRVDGYTICQVNAVIIPGLWCCTVYSSGGLWYAIASNPGVQGP